MEAIIKWFRVRYRSIVNSIAFLPAIIASLFLVLSWLMIAFDFSNAGKNIKSQLHWLSLKDATTARSIISSIVAGIISLTVFSFSMVMIVLNQAASQMSNRILDKLIGNRSQQWLLGFYIGTIVYALFLLSAIRDIDSGIYVPALSTYLLITLTIIDIFLFIYFLHYITTSVKYETIIGRIFKQTKESLEKSCNQKKFIPREPTTEQGVRITAKTSGIFQGFQQEKLLKLCEEENLLISFIYAEGTFILNGSPFAVVLHAKNISTETGDKIAFLTYIEDSEKIESNFYYGFRQLKEVAVKALSPGINDPGTAILSLHALADLLAFRSCNYPESGIGDSKDRVRILVNEKSFDQLFVEYFLPIWDYGRNDRSIRQEVRLILVQLRMQTKNQLVSNLLQEVEALESDAITLKRDY
ncbi:DUF2254 domain-containing protein [Segetibacter koreensis]|uniref:DUF2254 domain-containing protein n=1 Tax=Segetibacter koreensis TaxID=398037 RepID=UPI00035D57BB|nr:DUF2254 domain-containing protein [Segetibacter koreensis]